MQYHLVLLGLVGLLWSCDQSSNASKPTIGDAPILMAMNTHADSFLMDSLLTAVSIGICANTAIRCSGYGKRHPFVTNHPATLGCSKDHLAWDCPVSLGYGYDFSEG